MNIAKVIQLKLGIDEDVLLESNLYVGFESLKVSDQIAPVFTRADRSSWAENALLIAFGANSTKPANVSLL